MTDDAEQIAKHLANTQKNWRYIPRWLLVGIGSEHRG